MIYIYIYNLLTWNKKEYISCCDSKFHATQRSSDNLYNVYLYIYKYIYITKYSTIYNKGRFYNNSKIDTLISKRLSVKNKAKLSQLETQNTSRAVLFIYNSQLRSLWDHVEITNHFEWSLSISLLIQNLPLSSTPSLRLVPGRNSWIRSLRTSS